MPSHLPSYLLPPQRDLRVATQLQWQEPVRSGMTITQNLQVSLRLTGTVSVIPLSDSGYYYKITNAERRCR